MDDGLVLSQAPGRCAKRLLRFGKSARRACRCKLRPRAAEHRNPTQGGQGRLSSVRAQLLPALSPRCPSRAAGRYLHEPYRVPLCSEEKEITMSTDQVTARDRKSVVWGKSVSVRLDLGCRRRVKKK